MTWAAFLRFVALSALGLALAAWCGWASPAADMVNHAAPLWCALSAGAALLSHRLHQKTDAALFAIAAAMHLCLIAPELMRAAQPPLAPPANAQTFTLVTHNISDNNRDLARTRAILLAQNADFIALMEVDDATMAAFEPLRAQYPYWVRCNSWPYCRAFILSRHPPLPETRETPTGPLMLRRSPHYPLYGRFTAASFRLGDAPDDAVVRVIAVHAQRPPPLYAQERALRLLARELDRFPRDNVVLAGDFNLTPWSFALRRFDAESGLMRRTRALATWPAAFPVAPIDQICAGRAITTLSVRRGARTGSDHLPVTASFAIRRASSQ